MGEKRHPGWRRLNCGVLLLLIIMFFVPPGSAEAHAALERSEPTAGDVLSDPPQDVRIWFSEPLEPSYSGANLLDGTGAEISGTVAEVSAENDHELVMALPPDLPDGVYTVVWRNLSAADGHTLQGYFGFRVGAGVGSAFVPRDAGAGNETLRAVSRGLALIGLAAMLALVPMLVVVLEPVVRHVPALAATLPGLLRRYWAFALAISLAGSAIALAVQAAAIDADASLPNAVGGTLIDTRYGQLWLMRLALLVIYGIVVTILLWRGESWKGPTKFVLVGLTLALPLPYSLLSHAAAQNEGRAVAVALDALHLLAASIWVGGLFMLVLVLVPAMRALPAEDRGAVLREAIPRFSVIGVACWGVLVLSGLYAAWLQVGTIEALQGTDYGRTLVFKGVLLLPVLALAGFHFLLGWRGAPGEIGRVARTFAAEALVLIVLLLVVGRLIGLEPAREVVASRTPNAITTPITFAMDRDPREGTLTISPGVPGVNTFVLEIVGEALPDGSEGVLRFEMPNHDMGQQELRLAGETGNRFVAIGSELALAGDWRIEAIVRKIGAYSWSTVIALDLAATPPIAQPVNPAPLFLPSGVFAVLLVAIGIAGLSAALVSPGATFARRGQVAAIGVMALVGGSLFLIASRVPASMPPVQAMAETAAEIVATPGEGRAETAEVTIAPVHSDHATAEAAAIAGPGTPISKTGIQIDLEANPGEAGSTDVIVRLTTECGEPLMGARVSLFGAMAGMESDRVEAAAAETESGRYVAMAVPFGMAGTWSVNVRVSPKGDSTIVVPFQVDVP